MLLFFGGLVRAPCPAPKRSQIVQAKHLEKEERVGETKAAIQRNEMMNSHGVGDAQALQVLLANQDPHRVHASGDVIALHEAREAVHAILPHGVSRSRRQTHSR